MKKWTKVFSYADQGNPVTTIGVDHDGLFVVEFKNNLTALDGREKYVALLTLLETNKTQFEIESEKRIDKDKVDRLKSELYKFGLTVSQYWSELTIDWIETADLDNELIDLLESTILNKKISQRQRNKVKRIIKANKLGKWN
jgi:DNA primase